MRLDDPPTFRDLAERVHLSPYHFHRIFRGMTGESPAELVRRLRLERAAWQVRNTTMPITEIAFAAGYATHEAFTKAFQAAFRMAPSVFRSGTRDCPGIRSANGLHFHPAGLIIFHLANNGGIPMELEIVDVAPRRLAAVHHSGPYVEIGMAFGALAQAVAQLDLTKCPDTLQVALYLDDPETTPAQDLRSIAGVTVAEDADIGDLDEAQLPSGRFLRGTFVGHYAGLPDAWGQMYAVHVVEGGHTVRDGVGFEAYVSDHDTTPPDELRTDLYVPIA